MKLMLIIVFFGKMKNGEYIEMANMLVEMARGKKRTVFFNGVFVSIDYKNINYDNFELIEKSETCIEASNKFDKFYNIYLSDNKSISKILTDDLKEFIVNFREKYKIKFDISVKENKIYIRFFTGEMWQSNVSKEPIDKLSIYKYYVITKFAKELVEKMR